MSQKLNMSYSITRDLDLWQGLKEGNRRSLDKIYAAHVTSLIAYGRQFTVNTALIDDCIQELFVDLWIKRERLGDTDNIRFYLIKSVKRRILRMLKKESKSRPFCDMEGYFNEVVAVKPFVPAFSQKEHVRLIESLEKLSPLQKEIVFLKFFNGLSFEEIGEVLELNKKQLYNAMAKAIAKLRSLLGVILIIFLFQYLRNLRFT